MSIYTQLTDTDLRTVVNDYGLSPVNQIEAFQQGSENSNFRLDTLDESYVLTICETKSFEDATILAKTLDHLEREGFWTTKVIQNRSGNSVGSLGNKPILLKSYLRGQALDPIPIQTLEPLGRSLGQLHQIRPLECLPSKLSFGVESFQTLRDEYNKPHAFLDWLLEVENLLGEIDTDSLPKALIHGDVFADNIIHVEGRGPIIMDFEEAAVYYRIFDIGMTLVGTCRSGDATHEVNQDARANFLRGYRAAIQLRPEEEEVLNLFTAYAAAAMAAWRFRQFNLLFPDQGKQEHYRELQSVSIAALNAS